MAILQNPETGELRIVDDPSGLRAQGWREPSTEQADQAAKELDFGSVGQQAQAQGERIVRGATLGAVPGFGTPEDIRARADVSEKLSPVVSGAADIVPMVAAGALAATGVGAVAEGLGAAAGGAVAGTAALAGESAAGGLVQAGQAAYQRGQYLGEDPGLDAENALIFGGLNFGLGAASKALLGGAKGASRFAAEGEEAAVEGAGKATLGDVARQAESDAFQRAPTGLAEQAGAEATGAPLTSDTASQAAYQAAQGVAPEPGMHWKQTAPGETVDEFFARQAAARQAPSLVGKSLEDLGALPIEGEGDAARVAALQADEGFAATGRVPSNDAANGITLVRDGENLVLRDGRHRLTAAQNLGRESVFGTYVDGETGETLFQGEIPLQEALQAEAPAAKAAGGVAAERAAADDGMDRALSKASRSEANDIVEQAVGSKVPTPEADSFARQRALYQNRDAILDVSTREMQSDLTDLMQDIPNLARGGKIADVSRNVGENLSAQRALSDGIAENASALAGTLRGEAKAYAAELGKTGMQYAVPGSKDLVQALTEHAQALADADTGKAMFEAADAFKRVLDDHKLSFEGGMQNSLNPKAFQDLIPRVSSLASQVRTALEDASVWGKAGDMQKAYNSVISDQLIPNMKVFEEAVLKKTSKNYGDLWQMEGWENKIQGLLKGNDLGKVRHVNGVLDALDQLASVRSQYGDAATGTRMAERVAKIRRTMGLAEEVNDASARMQAIGGVAGHLPLVGGLAKEWVTGDLANAFRRLSGAVDRGIDRGVDDWIASSRLRGDSGGMLGKVGGFTARAITGSGEDSAVAATARRLGISHGLARFMGQDQNPQAAFERARGALQSDEQFFQSMGQDYKSLQQHAPETYLMLSGRAAGDRAFLMQRMPANVAVSMLRPQGYPPSRDAIEDWSIYWNALRDPMHVVSNIRSARIQEIQTLKERRPRLYERLQQRVIEKVGAAQTAGKPLDDSLLLRLSLLFDLDGAGTPAFSQQATQLAASWNAQQQPAAPSGPATGKLPAAMTPGPVQGIAQSGATFGSGF